MGLPRLPSSDKLLALNKSYWRNNFNTELGGEDERAYANWVDEQKALTGKNNDGDRFDYDTKGFWKSGLGTDERGHSSDQFKKPNHDTFSNQSNYNGAPDPWGGVYEGGQWDGGEGKPSTYTPASSMFRKTHDVGVMSRYMRDNEKESRLILPEGMEEKMYHGYATRKPFDGEDEFFKKNPTVAGMAAEDDRITLNPYSQNTPQQQESVARNEAIRLWMKNAEINPDFEVTGEQRKQFDGTEYAKPENENAMKSTLIARYLSGDPSSGQFTEMQKKWADSIKGKLPK